VHCIPRSTFTLARDIASFMTLDRHRDRFIDGMSRSVTGVTVVTTDGEMGRFGQTVSAMSSVSADPPMLLICINQKSPICTAILHHRVFGVNVLRSDQRRFAESFAGRPRRGHPYDFEIARWEKDQTGSPLLTGAVARFDCALESHHPAGTHMIFVGNVLSTSVGAGAPLLYARRGYGELHAFPNPAPASDVVMPPAEEEFEFDLGEL
jgi:flavin reductase (DIM6/NTAB) family NADH-FMN oxidoreductase RutF